VLLSNLTSNPNPHTPMPNMSYCRFENTASDLENCLEHFTDDLSKSEHSARKRIIELAREIVAEAKNYPDVYGASDDDGEEEDEG